jgi:hypothetical protein
VVALIPPGGEEIGTGCCRQSPAYDKPEVPGAGRRNQCGLDRCGQPLDHHVRGRRLIAENHTQPLPPGIKIHCSRNRPVRHRGAVLGDPFCRLPDHIL